MTKQKKLWEIIYDILYEKIKTDRENLICLSPIDYDRAVVDEKAQIAEMLLHIDNKELIEWIQLRE